MKRFRMTDITSLAHCSCVCVCELIGGHKAGEKHHDVLALMHDRMSASFLSLSYLHTVCSQSVSGLFTLTA